MKPLSEHLDVEMLQALHVQAERRLRNRAEAEDAVSKTVVRALQREETDKRWVPPGPPTAWTHLLGILYGVFKDVRRGWRRKPTSPFQEGDDPPSGGPNPEQAMVAREEVEERDELERQLRAALAAASNGAIPLAMLDHAAQGVCGLGELAKRIGCTPGEAENAQRRIARAGKKLLERRGGLAA